MTVFFRRTTPWLLLGALLLLLLAGACREEAQATPTPQSASEAEDSRPTNTPIPSPVPSATAMPTTVPSPAPTATPDNLAQIVNDEGGPVAISGVLSYTNAFFTLGVEEPLVLLEDQAGLIDDNEEFAFPPESQTLGQLTSDFETSPVSYTLALPAVPQGTYRDVDQDGESDTGVQVFQVAYWNNVFGDPFLEPRDGRGWSTAYSSLRYDPAGEEPTDIEGGALLVYAPDDAQGFPSGLGADGLLFTEDDPIVLLPAGFTLVRLDTDPFTFDRSREPVVNLVEPEGAARIDYSDLSYTEAFEALVETLRTEYAFTEYKDIDWDRLEADYRPFFEEADAENDADLYKRALHDFAQEIPDGHISGPQVEDIFFERAGGGLGLTVRELADGRVWADFILENGPADEAGIQRGSEIVTVDGLPVTDYISNTIPLDGPFSTRHALRQGQLLAAVRFPLGQEVQIGFTNPGSSSVRQATLTAVPEFASFEAWLADDERDGDQLPLSFELLPDGTGYVKIFSFSDNDRLTILLWERMIRTLQETNAPALIIDLRFNGGGRGGLANGMASYFFEEEQELWYAEYFDSATGAFERGEEPATLEPGPEELRYGGRVILLLGPACASACEFLSYTLTATGRAEALGYYPTAGLGGAIESVAMPEDEQFIFTQSRTLDLDGNIIIEGLGVAPSVWIPYDEAAFAAEDDFLLAAAQEYLGGRVVDGGALELDGIVEGSLEAGTRVQYRLDVPANEVVSVLLVADQLEPPLILNLYDLQGALLFTTEGEEVPAVTISPPVDLELIIEVASPENAGGGDYALLTATEQ